MTQALIRPAQAADIDEIVEVLREAAEFMAEKQGFGWRPHERDRRFVEPRVSRGEFLVAQAMGATVGTVVLQWEDLEFWPDHNDGSAGYLHRFAVRRAHAGEGIPAQLIDRAACIATSRGCSSLRLDCDHHLRRLYEGLGFAKKDEVSASAPSRAPLTVSRMEMRLV